MKLETWEDSQREDLNMIPTMLKYGFNVEFDERDIYSKLTTCDCPPRNPVKFTILNYYIWITFKWITNDDYSRTLKTTWVVAELNKDRRFVNHLHYDSLADVIIAFKTKNTKIIK